MNGAAMISTNNTRIKCITTLPATAFCRKTQRSRITMRLFDREAIRTSPNSEAWRGLHPYGSPFCLRIIPYEAPCELFSSTGKPALSSRVCFLWKNKRGDNRKNNKQSTQVVIHTPTQTAPNRRMTSDPVPVRSMIGNKPTTVEVDIKTTGLTCFVFVD